MVFTFDGYKMQCRRKNSYSVDLSDVRRRQFGADDRRKRFTEAQGLAAYGMSTRCDCFTILHGSPTDDPTEVRLFAAAQRGGSWL